MAEAEDALAALRRLHAAVMEAHWMGERLMTALRLPYPPEGALLPKGVADVNEAIGAVNSLQGRLDAANKMIAELKAAKAGDG